MRVLEAFGMTLAVIVIGFVIVIGVNQLKDAVVSVDAAPAANAEVKQDDLAAAESITLTLYPANKAIPEVIKPLMAAVNPMSNCVTYQVGNIRSFYCGDFKLEITLPKVDPNKVKPEVLPIPKGEVTS